jgi:hypothetical protein
VGAVLNLTHGRPFGGRGLWPRASRVLDFEFTRRIAPPSKQ